MNPPTTLTNHNPPATIGCCLNPNPIRREESDTPQVQGAVSANKVHEQVARLALATSIPGYAARNPSEVQLADHLHLRAARGRDTHEAL